MSDGKSASITAPNGSAQKKLMEKALKVSNVKPSFVDYIECHGTGTALGDPIEVEALAEVFSQFRSQSNPLIVGAVKANIGHLECAAGISGLIKAALVLGHRCALPNAALDTLNPLIKKTIDSKEFAILFPTGSQPLSTGEHKLLVAGVSSFGYSGTICHTILQEAPEHVHRDTEMYSEEVATLNMGWSLSSIEGHGTPSSSLDQLFPNHTSLPWPGSLPHPLLQRSISQSKSCEFETVFHDRLIEFFGDHNTFSGTIFPVAAYVEIGLAAGSLVRSKGTSVELVDIEFVHPLEVTLGRKLMSTHQFYDGMHFVELSPESSSETIVASISKINGNPAVLTPSESLNDLKMKHTKDIQLAMDNSRHGVYWTIQSVKLAEGGMSVLAQIGLLKDSLHEHDNYYHVHTLPCLMVPPSSYSPCCLIWMEAIGHLPTFLVLLSIVLVVPLGLISLSLRTNQR